MKTSRLENVDALRGVAALSVVLFHFVFCEKEWLGENALTSIMAWGKLGVPVFFVLSGFVLPYSLDKARYTLASYPRFILRRLARLEPPYIVALAFSLVVGLILYHASRSGTPPIDGPWHLLSHIGYLTGLFEKAWVNPVFWTLALEFQFYLLLGVVFPLLVSVSAGVRLASFGGLLIMGMIPAQTLVFAWLPLFALGIATFLFITKRADRLEYAALLVLAFVFASQAGEPSSIAALLTALCIAFVPIGGAVLGWLGAVSYSLYLFHYPIGKIVIGVGKYADINPTLTIACATVASLAVAWAAHRWVELPSQRFASRITYKPKEEPMFHHELTGKACEAGREGA